MNCAYACIAPDTLLQPLYETTETRFGAHIFFFDTEAFSFLPFSFKIRDNGTVGAKSEYIKANNPIETGGVL